MSNHDLDEELLPAIRNGATTREKLMAIEPLRQRTWAVVADRLNILTKRQALIASKQGWRIASN